jgi:hypothetical protein
MENQIMDADGSPENVQLADNDMLVDEYEQYKDEKADVVLVSPPDSLEEQEAEPLADDCMNLHLSPFLSASCQSCVGYKTGQFPIRHPPLI